MRSCLSLGLALLSAAATAQTCGICPSGNESGSVGSFPSAALQVLSAPTGNSPLTWSALSVQGETGQDDEREFLVSLGLVSNRGNESRPTPFHDKVALYAAVEAHPGSGDVWAFNPLVTQMPGSGDYNAQGIELDFNNENSHRGEADAGAGLAPPVSYGLSISGAAPFRSTSAMLVSGSGRIWNRGIVFANDCIQQSTFQDLGSPAKSVDIRGNPTFGVYQSSASTKNLFAGGTGVGLGSEEALDPSFALHVGSRGLRVDGPLAVWGSALLPLRLEGTASLDAEGSAQVELLLGKEAELFLSAGGSAGQLAYSLTALGAPMPSLHVAQEVEGGKLLGAAQQASFRVGGGAPGGRVSWAVSVPLQRA
jgi:hypothetical protein